MLAAPLAIFSRNPPLARSRISRAVLVAAVARNALAPISKPKVTEYFRKLVDSIRHDRLVEAAGVVLRTGRNSPPVSSQPCPAACRYSRIRPLDGVARSALFRPYLIPHIVLGGLLGSQKAPSKSFRVCMIKDTIIHRTALVSAQKTTCVLVDFCSRSSFDIGRFGLICQAIPSSYQAGTRLFFLLIAFVQKLSKLSVPPISGPTYDLLDSSELPHNRRVQVGFD